MQRAKEVVASGHWSGEPADVIVLEFEERYRRRAEFAGVGGLAFTLDLAEAAMLRGGDGLKLDDGRIVEVVAAPEPLIEIRAADPLILIRIALRLGNYHAPAEATAKALRVRRDPEIEAMAKSLGARVIPLEAPFNPEGAAYVMAAAEAHSHHHAHSHPAGDHGHHSHDHYHDYDHDHEHGHHADDHRHGRDHSAHCHEPAVHHHRGEEDGAD